jgi:hypothetical protein
MVDIQRRVYDGVKLFGATQGGVVHGTIARGSSESRDYLGNGG